jgi:hypothetical protein
MYEDANNAGRVDCNVDTERVAQQQDCGSYLISIQKMPALSLSLCLWLIPIAAGFVTDTVAGSATVIQTLFYVLHKNVMRKAWKCTES